MRLRWLGVGISVLLLGTPVSADTMDEDAVEGESHGGTVRECLDDSKRLCFTPKGPEAEIAVSHPEAVVTTLAPIIEWVSVEGAEAYLITIRQGQDELWRFETQSTQIQSVQLADQSAYLLSIAALSREGEVIAQARQAFNVWLTSAH